MFCFDSSVIFDYFKGTIMKGSRHQLPSRQSGVSGEPILRPYSGAASRYSRTHTASPTFDFNMSSYDETPVNKESNDGAVRNNLYSL